MNPEQILAIISALVGAAGGAAAVYVALARLGGDKRKTEAETERLRGEERRKTEAETERLHTENIIELRKEIDCLHDGQRELRKALAQRESEIADLRRQWERDVERLEAENAGLRQKLNEYQLELKKWRAGRKKSQET